MKSQSHQELGERILLDEGLANAGLGTRRPAVAEDGGEASLAGAGEQGAGEEVSTEGVRLVRQAYQLTCWDPGRWILALNCEVGSIGRSSE